MVSDADTPIHVLWQAQSGETPTPALDDVRTRAARLDAHTRRWKVLGGALFVVLLSKGALEVWTQTGTLERAGDLLLLTALLYVAYRFRTQRMAAPAVALGTTNCVAFYRAEFLRQRDLSTDNWGYLLPFVPGTTLVILDGVLDARRTSDQIVLVLLGIALFVCIASWNAYAARKLQRELDTLEGL